MIKINLFKGLPPWINSGVARKRYEQSLADNKAVVRWHDLVDHGPSEGYVEHALTSAQLQRVDDAPPLIAFSETFARYVNPDTWTEDEERVLLVNGYPYPSPQVEGERLTLLRRAGKRHIEERRKRLRLELLKQYTRRIKYG